MHIPHMLHHFILSRKPSGSDACTARPSAIYKLHAASNVHDMDVAFEVCFAGRGVCAVGEEAVECSWSVGC